MDPEKLSSFEHSGTSLLPPLKLKAEDEEDLTILSTYLQDALVPLISMTHAPQESRFSILTHRFRWEKNPPLQEKPSLYERINSLLHFHHVQSVTSKGLEDPHDPNKTLNLLCITFHKNTILLTFSDDAHIQLTVEKIFVFLGDTNIYWPTSVKPSHFI